MFHCLGPGPREKGPSFKTTTKAHWVGFASLSWKAETLCHSRSPHREAGWDGGPAWGTAEGLSPAGKMRLCQRQDPACLGILCVEANTQQILQTLCNEFVVVQSLCHVWLFAIPWTAACQASLSFTISQSLLKLKGWDDWMESPTQRTWVLFWAAIISQLLSLHLISSPSGSSPTSPPFKNAMPSLIFWATELLAK